MPALGCTLVPVICRPSAPSVAWAAPDAPRAAKASDGTNVLRQTDLGQTDFGHKFERAFFDFIASPSPTHQGASSALGNFHVPSRTAGFGP